MSFFFANPWGLLALLGIPAVVVIHLLRRKSRRVVVSTLFLLERVLPSSEGGRRLRLLQNSLPLWVQIFAVIALTWLLARPRWIDAQSTQTVVAVFDASASMEAFRDETLLAASRELDRVKSASAKTQWIFLRSDAARLAAGPELSAVLADLEKNWHPVLGTHDTTEAFRLARALAGQKGTVMYFTDHRPGPDEAAGISWVACGDVIENTGFLGAGVQDGRWNALLKNFGTQTREARWRIAGQEQWQTVSLPPGGMTEISGGWPADSNRLVLETEEDRFTLDNRLPLLQPVPKSLTVHAAESAEFRPLFEQLLRIAEPASPGLAGAADVSLGIYSPLTPQAQKGAALIFVEDSAKEQKPLSGLIIAENHPLMENLNWQGLMVRDTFGMPFREGDTALLWQGSRPLIFLRTQDQAPQLVFNFDVRRSNALRLPAFALLAHRFFSTVRANKVAPESANVETRQQIPVAGVGEIRAPAVPGFFTANSADGTPLFDGAAHFADSRESEFLKASRGSDVNVAVETIRQSHARGEFLNPLWTVLLAGLMLWNWLLTGAPAVRPRAAG